MTAYKMSLFFYISAGTFANEQVHEPRLSEIRDWSEHIQASSWRLIYSL